MGMLDAFKKAGFNTAKVEAEKESQNKGGFSYGNMGRNNGRNNGKAGNRPPQQQKGPSMARANAEKPTSPYNFIPLPEKAVVSPLGKFLEGDFDKYGEYIKEIGNLTGYIDLEITTVTPTCISLDSKFYAPNGLPTIPGSTLRGMFKNHMKIISCGTMRAKGNEDMTSRHLYYRDFASTINELKNLYKGKMMTKKDITIHNDETGEDEEKSIDVSKASAGFLARLSDNSYVIYPADFKVVPYEKRLDADGNPVYTEDKDGNKKYQYIVPDSLNNKIIPNSVEVECHTGKMDGKGHYYVLSNVDWKREITVPGNVIKEYKADKNRNGLDLLSRKADISKSDFARGHFFSHLAPCFYLEEEGVALHFGYGKYYRIPYDKAIEEHIPESLRDKDIVDFAESIFGRKEDFGSRVFFEDAVSKNLEKLLDPDYSHNLMGANPTSFQIYLEQNDRKLSHWDDDAYIRGYKMYWHNNIRRDDWKRDATDKVVKGTTPIQPIHKDAVFKGRIRFENFTKEELGALISVIELGKSGKFKVGIGKPLGMGTIDLKATDIAVFDESARYSNLFKNGDWDNGSSAINSSEYVNAFKKYMANETKVLGIEDRYKKVLETLEIMMNWDNRPDPQELKYMDVKDTRYKYRSVLPKPEEVMRKK